MKFKDPVNRKNLLKVKSPSGSHFYMEKKWRYDDDGNFVHKEVGKPKNLYERIQAARDGCDLRLMLQRYEAGEAAAILKVEGMYLDTVDIPKTYAELYNTVQVHGEVFNSMPAEIKEAYHNNPAEYWKAFGTKEFDDTLNAFRKEIYGRYGMDDPNPVDSSGQAIDTVIDRPVDGAVEPTPFTDKEVKE